MRLSHWHSGIEMCRSCAQSIFKWIIIKLHCVDIASNRVSAVNSSHSFCVQPLTWNILDYPAEKYGTDKIGNVRTWFNLGSTSIKLKPERMYHKMLHWHQRNTSRQNKMKNKTPPQNFHLRCCRTEVLRPTGNLGGPHPTHLHLLFCHPNQLIITITCKIQTNKKQYKLKNIQVHKTNKIE